MALASCLGLLHLVYMWRITEGQDIEAFLIRPPSDTEWALEEGRRLILTCSVKPGYQLNWEIEFASVLSSELETHTLDTRTNEPKRYSATWYGTQKSSLAIVAQEEGVVKCVATSMERERFLSGDLSISVSTTTSPSAIVSVDAKAVETNVILFSWESSDTMKNMYTFTAVNMDNSSVSPIVEYNLVDKTYKLSFDTKWICDDYDFIITADYFNSVDNIRSLGAPNSTMLNIASILPSDITHIMNTLSYVLKETDEGVEITLTFKNTPKCREEKPFTKYSLQVLDSYRTSLNDYTGQISNTLLTETVVYPVKLKVRKSYLYRLEMQTDSNRSSTPGYGKFNTNTLQGFRLCQADKDRYQIQCCFLMGSSVPGCVYSLQVSDGEGLISYNGTISPSETYPEVVSAEGTFVRIMISSLGESSYPIVFQGPITQCTEIHDIAILINLGTILCMVILATLAAMTIVVIFMCRIYKNKFMTLTLLERRVLNSFLPSENSVDKKEKKKICKSFFKGFFKTTEKEQRDFQDDYHYKEEKVKNCLEVKKVRDCRKVKKNAEFGGYWN